MFQYLRLDTVHPALVHLPLGVIPLMLIAYFVASASRSARWAFVADVSLAFAVVVTTAAAAFGYVSYFIVRWPGGLEPWPLVHLILGTATTVAVWLLGLLRLLARRRDRNVEVSARARRWFALRWAWGALGVAVLAAATGYVGGEVLVYHGGIAVRSGAGGVMAPPLRTDERAPKSVADTMQRLRPLWASSIDLAAQAVAVHPERAAFARIADHARQMQKLARWLADWGAKPEAQSNAEVAPTAAGAAATQGAQAGAPGAQGAKVGAAATQGAQAGAPGAQGGAQQAAQHAGSSAPAEQSKGRDHDMRRFALQLQTSAAQLEQAAHSRDLLAVLDSIGAVSGSCTRCHMTERWKKTPALARREPRAP